MPLVKLIITDYHDGGDYGRDLTYIAKDITDWEDISDADLALLNKYKWELKTMLVPNDTYGMNVVILTQDHVPIMERIADLKEKIKDKLEADKAKAEKQRKAAAERRAKLAIQKAIKERQQLEALAKKHGVEIPEIAGLGGNQGAKQ